MALTVDQTPYAMKDYASMKRLQRILDYTHYGAKYIASKLFEHDVEEKQSIEGEYVVLTVKVKIVQHEVPANLETRTKLQDTRQSR